MPWKTSDVFWNWGGGGCEEISSSETKFITNKVTAIMPEKLLCYECDTQSLQSVLYHKLQRWINVNKWLSLNQFHLKKNRFRKKNRVRVSRSLPGKLTKHIWNTTFGLGPTVLEYLISSPNTSRICYKIQDGELCHRTVNLQNSSYL